MTKRKPKVSGQKQININFAYSTPQIREDIRLSRLAEEAENQAKGKDRIPAEKVWEELDLQ